MLVNGRFRTAGGVFFHLVRKSGEIRTSVKNKIFKTESRYWSAKKEMELELAKFQM